MTSSPGSERSEFPKRPEAARSHEESLLMDVVSDARLMELVREPAKELLPAARRASVVQPLVVLLAFLPGVLGFWNPTLDEATSRQGLLALDVVASERPSDWFVTATRESSAASQRAFPLQTLLSALGLRAALLTPEGRLHLVSYLSSAFLVLSLSGLARRAGGHRMALLVALLACGHREFLIFSETLPAVPLPLAFGVLSLHAMLAHRESEAEWLSWPLIGCGCGLAACWLSGGGVAWAIAAVLLAWNLATCFECRISKTSKSWSRVLRQRLSIVAVSIVNLGSVLLIAGVLVAGWRFAFAESMSLPSLAENSWWLRRLWPAESRLADVSQTLIPLLGAWLGFVVIGAVVGARLEFRQDRPTKEWLPLMASWCLVAGLSGWLMWPDAASDGNAPTIWSGFVLLPLLFLAAAGVEVILNRQLGIASVLVTTLLTIGVVASSRWSPRWSVRIEQLGVGTGVVLSAIALSVAVFIVRRAAASESGRRGLLLSCVMLLMLLDVAAGFFARPKLMDDERELLAFRRQLLNDQRPDECWLIADDNAPARLRYFLRSVWRGVPLREVPTWEAVFTNVSSNPTGQRSVASSSEAGTRKARALVVTWGQPKRPAEEVKRRGQVLTQTTAPHYFQGRPFKSFRWQERIDAAIAR